MLMTRFLHAHKVKKTPHTIAFLLRCEASITKKDVHRLWGWGTEEHTARLTPRAR